ncbi:hypothetical protein Enr8_04430 [Blastopirellula retiformator]|uniref:Uncharacterized protein n=1 Tax=Blastopirellula retiformator TaxID=2527970 RepID=A0A5C5VLX1_9BACT|nr:hypothetical protein Enr8_04430 [Blastopirellula retiformator]
MIDMQMTNEWRHVCDRLEAAADRHAAAEVHERFAEFPKLREHYAKYAPHGFEIVGVSSTSKAMKSPGLCCTNRERKKRWAGICRSLRNMASTPFPA